MPNSPSANPRPRAAKMAAARTKVSLWKNRDTHTTGKAPRGSRPLIVRRNDTASGERRTPPCADGRYRRDWWVADPLEQRFAIGTPSLRRKASPVRRQRAGIPRRFGWFLLI